MALNCAGLPESMAETELFGYGPGAFEGARPEGKLGLLELTAGGTLFLDGVGEMSPRLQASCCASCRTAVSAGSAATRRCTWTCG